VKRIVFASFGSLGDLHPVLALALELRHRGHRVEIATMTYYREKIAALGLEHRTIRPDITVIDETMVRQIMDGHRGSARLLRELMFPAVHDMYADLSPIVSGADLLVTSELVYAAPILAEKTGVPWVSYALAPISLFSIHDPSRLPLPPGWGWIQSLGPGANRLVRSLAERATHSWWKPVRDLRQEQGLPPGKSPLFAGKHSSRLDLALFSPVLQSPQPDWPANTVQTGFPFYDEPRSPSLPPAVEVFLAAGEPPIVFTLGSSAVYTAGDFYAQSAQAAQQLGRRALLLLGQNPPPPNLPPALLAWDYLPFAQLFPRAAAIVHQGGVCTTAQALRAGKPTLIMPFSHDQPDNAARVRRLGVSRTTARASYNAPRAARELTALLADPAYSQKAAAVGARVRNERGVETACDALERQL